MHRGQYQQKKPQKNASSFLWIFFREEEKKNMTKYPFSMKFMVEMEIWLKSLAP